MANTLAATTKGTSIGIRKLRGRTVTINSQDIEVLDRDDTSTGYVRYCSGTVTITDGGAGYAVGCIYIKTNGGAGTVMYINEGTTSSCDFNPVETPSAVITGVTAESLTSTADGLTTGLMSGNTSHAIVTSASATNWITLPASSAALLGRTFTIWVGANGFELVTPGSSNATINGTDSDGTNQCDIPANSMSRLTLVNTDTWLLENIGSNGAVAAAITPDND